MKEYVAKQKQVALRAGGAALILAILASAFGRFPQAVGVLIGCAVTLLNFRLLALGIERILALKEPRAAQIQAFLRYSLRYFTVMAVMWVVSLNPEIDLLATAVGLLLVKAVILVEAIFTYIHQLLQSNLYRSERGE